MVTLWFFVFLLGNFFVFGNAACPRIITRAEWGARPPVSTPSNMTLPVPYAVVHHGGIKSYCTTQDQCAAIVRSYQNYHIDNNKWNDIGYNFVVGEDGNVYEGRGWGDVGAHAPNYNSRSIGICIIGDFTDLLPNEAALNAVKNLIQCGVDTDRIIGTYALIGHRQATSTACPGNALYDEIGNWPHWTANP